MGQVNFYLPDELEKRLRATAKKKGVSVSRVLTEAVREKLLPQKKKNDLAQYYGCMKGEFPDIESLPVDDVEMF